MYFYSAVSIDLFVLVIAICIGIGTVRLDRAVIYSCAASVAIPLLFAVIEWPFIDAFGPHTVGVRRQEFVIRWAVDPSGVNQIQVSRLVVRIATTAAAAAGIAWGLCKLQLRLYERATARLKQTVKGAKIARYALWLSWLPIAAWSLVNSGHKVVWVSLLFLLLPMLAILTGVVERRLRLRSTTAGAPV